MQEILIPKALIVLFLFVSIIRPFVRKLKPVKGLALLPILALFTCIVIIPAYGFRPEVLPLFVFALILNLANASRRVKSRARYRSSYREPQFVFAVPVLILLAAASWVAFSFSPRTDTALSTHGVYALREWGYNIRVYVGQDQDLELDQDQDLADIALFQSEYFEYEYFVPADFPFYTPPLRPLLALLPPAIGSLAAVDLLAVELRNRGFTVVTIDRSGGTNPARWFGIARAFLAGTTSVRANADGRRLEEERKDDVRILLSWIMSNPQINDSARLFDITSADAIFLGGYDTGGSALLLLFDTLFSGTLPAGINVRGIMITVNVHANAVTPFAQGINALRTQGGVCSRREEKRNPRNGGE